MTAHEIAEVHQSSLHVHTNDLKANKKHDVPYENGNAQDSLSYKPPGSVDSLQLSAANSNGGRCVIHETSHKVEAKENAVHLMENDDMEQGVEGKENAVHMMENDDLKQSCSAQQYDNQIYNLSSNAKDSSTSMPKLCSTENSESLDWPESERSLTMTFSAPSLSLPDQSILRKDEDSAAATSSEKSTSTNCSDRGLARSSTMPSRTEVSGSRERPFTRSNTDKGGGNNKENFRKVDKLSDKKKEKLLKKMATIKKDGTVELNDAKTAEMLPISGIPETICPGECIEDEERKIQPLQIAMLIVGTRGDVQPFVAIGKHLQEYGHRVRLATHANFRQFVMASGLEFYPLGGDPKVLAEYMVKNKGFLPSSPSEIPIQRKQLKSIINSLLAACTEADGELSVPFRAQALIANPPAYGHVHVAEYLQVPLHIFFTMPWTPTSEFPHPLARLRNAAANRLSYQVVDSLIWMGIRSMINEFRKKKLKLRPVTYLSGSQGTINDLPTGYIWSPHLVPKPKDWGPLIDVVGFCFLNLKADYTPPEALVQWLRAGPSPIYIGFGSLPVENPERITEIIIQALEQTKQRGIIVRGWGGIGNLKHDLENVYLLENCPHDWLFPQCAAVVHHGGAGTTAAGLQAACPTTIVPFFGDQPFWGERVHAKGVGPAPIPINQFNLEKLVAAIQFMLSPEVKQKALELAKFMESEDGVEGAVNAFHRHLPAEMPKVVQPIHKRISFINSLMEKLHRIFCC